MACRARAEEYAWSERARISIAPREGSARYFAPRAIFASLFSTFLTPTRFARGGRYLIASHIISSRHVMPWPSYFNRPVSSIHSPIHPFFISFIVAICPSLHPSIRPSIHSLFLSSWQSVHHHFHLSINHSHPPPNPHHNKP